MKVFLIAALGLNIAFGAVLPEEKQFELPEGVPTCDQDDPELSKCIKDAINFMLPKLGNGLEALNIPSLDPFVMPKNRFDVNYGNIQASLFVKDVKSHGMSKAIVKDVDTKITDNGLKSHMEWYIPRVTLEGKYKANAKINEIKMTPKGYFNVTLDRTNVAYDVEGVFQMKNGVKHLQLTSIDMKPNVGNAKIIMTGLFPDPTLNEIAVDFLNQNWKQLYEFFIPATRDRWEPILLEQANEFLSKVPIEAVLTKKQN